jgi:hypothetical protein
LQKAGVKTIRADLCRGQDGIYDLLFMANVYHGIRRACKDAILNNFKMMTRKYVAIMDFKEDTFFGPPFKIKKEEVISDMEKHGFTLVRSKDLRFHYITLFKKQ